MLRLLRPINTQQTELRKEGGVKLSSSAKTGKALAHRGTAIGAAGGAIVSLAVVGAVAVWVAVCAVVANPVGLAIAGAGAICAAAAVAYLAVTGVSIRDLYRSWQQVIQVKEEGLVTVQSLQPVLTPITPIAGKIGCDEIGDAVGANVAEGGKVAVEDAGTSWGTKEGEVAKAAAAAAGLVALDAALAVGCLVLGSVAGGAIVGAVALTGTLVAVAAYVYKRKTAQKAATFGIELAKGGGAITEAAGAQGAKSVGGVVTGAELVAAQKAAPGKEAVEAYAREAVEDAAGNVVEAQLGAQAAAVKALTGVGGGEAIVATGKGTAEVLTQTGRAAVEIAKASTSNSDVMKSLAGEKDFLDAGAALYQAITDASGWEPVVGNVATVAQQSRAR